MSHYHGQQIWRTSRTEDENRIENERLQRLKYLYLTDSRVIKIQNYMAEIQMKFSMIKIVIRKNEPPQILNYLSSDWDCIYKSLENELSMIQTHDYSILFNEKRNRHR